MNPRVLEIETSLIRRIAAHRRPTSIDLGLGEPSLMPNPAHFEYAMRYIEAHGVRYSPNAGDPALREAIARHYDYPGMHAAQNVCVTTGSQEAMYVTIKTLLDPARDELLVVEPTFPSYIKMARLEGIGVRGVAMDAAQDFAIDAQRIVDAIGERTRAIVICSPNNPTGRVLRNEQADILVNALEARAGEPVWLIHDEIYREQSFVDDEAFLAERYPHTVVTNSVSKSNALTGLRLGWLIGPEDFVENAIKTHAWVTSCTDTFAQQVALHIFTELTGINEHVSWYRAQWAGVMESFARKQTAFHSGGRQLLRLRAAPQGCDLVRCCDAAHRGVRCVGDPWDRVRKRLRRLAAPELGSATRKSARRHQARHSLRQRLRLR